jgi:hypothetical protein
VRISIPEALDAMACAGQPGMLADKADLKAALRVALIKTGATRRCSTRSSTGSSRWSRSGRPRRDTDRGHGHEDLSDTGAVEEFTLSEEPSETPQQGHSHGKPVDVRDYFDPEDLAQQYDLDQEANKIVLSKDNQGVQGEGNRVQIETDRLSNAGPPGQISPQQGTKVDADLSVAEREALLALEQRIVESNERAVATVDRVGEHERLEPEGSLRRLAHSLHGGLAHRRRVAATGRIDSGATMRRNMRFDGIPFSPITVRRAEDKPRLVVLTDVSLSVRATARSTLHLVHGVQNLFGQVRTFAFVAELVEITDLFEDHPVEHALGLVLPRYSWGLSGCDLPAYAEFCSRVRVLRDLTGLESAATDLAAELVGR